MAQQNKTKWTGYIKWKHKRNNLGNKRLQKAIKYIKENKEGNCKYKGKINLKREQKYWGFLMKLRTILLDRPLIEFVKKKTWQTNLERENAKK